MRIYYIDISNVAKHRVKFVHVTFFCSQVFKTSDVLNSDEKFCKYCFDYFLLAGGDKVG